MFTKKFALDLGERVLATYLQAFIGLLIVAQVLDINAVKAAAIAAIPATLAVIKGAIGHYVGDPESPSLVASVPNSITDEAEYEYTEGH